MHWVSRAIMNKDERHILGRSIRITKIFIYLIITILKLVYLLIIFLRYYIILRIRWRLSLYRTRRIINKMNLDKAETDKISRDIVGDFPSLKELYRIFKESMRYE